MLSFQKEHGSGEGFKDCKHAALQSGAWKIIPSLGGSGRQQVDTGGNLEAGNHGQLHWQRGGGGWLAVLINNIIYVSCVDMPKSPGFVEEMQPVKDERFGARKRGPAE